MVGTTTDSKAGDDSRVGEEAQPPDGESPEESRRSVQMEPGQREFQGKPLAPRRLMHSVHQLCSEGRVCARPHRRHGRHSSE